MTDSWDGKMEMSTIKLSEEIELLKPILIQFIIDLKYSNKKAELFSEGYISELKKLPTMEKMKAINTQYDPCMEAGFLAAKIDENEALKRFKLI